MDNIKFAADTNLTTQLSDLIVQLAERFPIDYVYCFACTGGGKSPYHYGLLVLTAGLPSGEHRMQDYVNTHFEGGTVSLLAHPAATVLQELRQAHRFFTWVLRDGLELYARNEAKLRFSLVKPNPKTTLRQAERAFYHHQPLITGFLEGAWQCIETGHDAVAAFLLHQAAEQALAMSIKVVMGYRTTMHSLHRLLGLCRCFTGRLDCIFDRQTAEGERLFGLLATSYSQARYGERFTLTQEEAQWVYTRVMMLADAAEQLCLEQIDSLRATISKDAVTQLPAIET